MTDGADEPDCANRIRITSACVALGPCIDLHNNVLVVHTTPAPVVHTCPPGNYTLCDITAYLNGVLGDDFAVDSQCGYVRIRRDAQSSPFRCSGSLGAALCFGTDEMSWECTSIYPVDLQGHRHIDVVARGVRGGDVHIGSIAMTSTVNCIYTPQSWVDINDAVPRLVLINPATGQLYNNLIKSEVVCQFR